ncbi:hypothetical protein CS0771_38890 [Catellatospora sp. IY07-71]|uniref:hypothetical protein n=1 Tax=Catellatospora sp. IY07-71 TaxID=2728827 RepID=UPI001BB40B24|nr:hypothetical protein [Catellatospora sp. IY07-71]BCJ74345.1 hypothetical protein CS0771_38890 [Catellatospora sp. IY07-71]
MADEEPVAGLVPGIDDPGPLGAVREGMPVRDSTGAELGTVAAVKIGDADAVTADGQRMSESYGLFGRIRQEAAGPEPDVEAELAELLLREGYIKIKSRMPLRHGRYAGAAQIAAVRDGTVTLSVPGDQLAREA